MGLIEANALSLLQGEFSLYGELTKDKSLDAVNILPLFNHPRVGHGLRRVFFPEDTATLDSDDNTKEEVPVRVSAAKREAGDDSWDFSQLLQQVRKKRTKGKSDKTNTSFLAGILSQVPIHSLFDDQKIYSVISSSEYNVTNLSLFDFCAELVNAYLVKYPPARELVPYERGLLIDLARRGFEYSSFPSSWENHQERTEVIQTFLDDEGSFGEDGIVDPLRVKPIFAKVLADCMRHEPVDEHVLSPSELYQVLSEGDISWISLLRGGCFGGLEQVAKDHGYGDEYRAYFGDDHDAPWKMTSYATYGSRGKEHSILSLLIILQEVRKKGADSVRDHEDKLRQPDGTYHNWMD